MDYQHKNGLAEIIIRDIQDNGRYMMLHFQRKCPEAITNKVWPYSLRHANNDNNPTPLLAHPCVLSPLQIFTGTQFKYNPNNCQPFGWPTYVLNEALSYSQRIHHTWKTRSKVGVYLGRSFLHNHDVALVLNLRSSLVRPQFHVWYYPLFTTTKYFDSSSL